MTISFIRPIRKKQTTLFELESNNITSIFPTTRYQGSKNKIIDWI
jgi:hypothetical protein